MTGSVQCGDDLTDHTLLGPATIVQCAATIVQCAATIVQCIASIVQCVESLVCSQHCAVFSVQCSVSIVPCVKFLLNHSRTSAGISRNISVWTHLPARDQLAHS